MNSAPDEHQYDMKNLRIKFPNEIIIRHLNISSIRNKFELLSSPLGGKIEILMMRETKLDATFHANQLFIQGYSNMYKLDRNYKAKG